MYQRCKDFAKAHSKGKLTLGEFHNEIIKHPSIDCITVKGEECYTNYAMNLMTQGMMTSTDMKTP